MKRAIFAVVAAFVVLFWCFFWCFSAAFLLLFCFFVLTACQSITDELRETKCLDQRHDDIACQSRVPQTPICNPPNKTQTLVMQEAVRACARLRLILARPELYIAAVLHARCLLTVVSQVPIINFCELFMTSSASSSVRTLFG